MDRKKYLLDYIGEMEKNLSRLPKGENRVWITTTEFNQLTGYNQEYTRQLLHFGKLGGNKWAADGKPTKLPRERTRKRAKCTNQEGIYKNPKTRYNYRVKLP